MPDVYEQDVKPVSPDPGKDAQLISRLFEYKKPTQNPWRADYAKELKECYNFVELKQWTQNDETLLKTFDVPAVPIDRINRGLATINGIRENSNLKKRVAKRELGDERVARVLDLALDQISYDGKFDAVTKDVFDDLLEIGWGIKKCGYDPEANNGLGAIWSERVNVEDFGCSKFKNKDLSDIRWCWQEQVMDWEDAMLLSPEKAGELKAMRSVLSSEWEKMKSGSVKGSAGVDYQAGSTVIESAYPYPNQVKVTEFWIERRIPFKNVGYLETQDVSDPVTGQTFQIPVPKIRQEAIDYAVKDGEQLQGTGVQRIWEQYILAGDERSNILLKTGQDEDHPYTGYIAKRKKSGMPRGFVFEVIPHQQRSNLAWAQKIAFNNKAIKAGLVIEGAPDLDIQSAVQSSSMGAILRLPLGGRVVAMNLNPNVNLQAIEEINAAHQDMDFAAAATEGALRGVAATGDSGIKLSLQQNAAVTPLNKWVSAFMQCERTFQEKILRLLIRYYTPDQIKRIVGDVEFQKEIIGPLDPVSGQPTLPPIEFPLDINLLHYDIVIEDSALSDFNKQQTFNAVMALKGAGTAFTDDFLIKNAPIKDIDSALESNEKARNDIIQNLLAQNQMLQEMLGQAQKMLPKTTNQSANAQRGKAQPQAGQRSMLGGTSPLSPLG